MLVTRSHPRRSGAPHPAARRSGSASRSNPRTRRRRATHRSPRGAARSSPPRGCGPSAHRRATCVLPPNRPCREAGGPSGSHPGRATRRARVPRQRYLPRGSRSRPRKARWRRVSGSSRCRRRSGRRSPSYPPAMAIRLVVADDHLLVREGIRRLLETQPDIEIAAVCDDLDSLLAAVERERPDVVVTDIRMPPANTDEGIQAAVQIRETHPEIGVVVLSQYATPSYALALLDSGSERRSYLLKERVQDLDYLVAAIRAVAEGGSVIDPKVVEALVAKNARGEESRLSQLTPRERDVLREMAEGKSNAGIGESLFLAERSVEKVIHSVFLKLGLTWETSVHKRVKAVILYLGESD